MVIEILSGKFRYEAPKISGQIGVGSNSQPTAAERQSHAMPNPDSLSGPESIDLLLRVGEYVNAMREAESDSPPDDDTEVDQ